MKPTKITLIGMSLFFVVICGTAFAAMMVIGNYIVAAIDFLAVMFNVLSIVMLLLIREK